MCVCVCVCVCAHMRVSVTRQAWVYSDFVSGEDRKFGVHEYEIIILLNE